MVCTVCYLKQSSAGFYTPFDRQPLHIHDGQIHTYCISMYGIIHQNEKGLLRGAEEDCKNLTRCENSK